MKANINSKLWDIVPVVGFFILAATEGKAYPIGRDINNRLVSDISIQMVIK